MKKISFENNAGKAENAGNQHYLFAHQVTNNIFYQMKDQFNVFSLYHTIPTFDDPKTEAFWKHCRQEGQDGPGLLTWFFEIALANFFLSLSEKNLLEFLNVCTVQEASIH